MESETGKEEKVLDFSAIEKKWRNIWKEKKAFEADACKKKKFLLTFPYPYMNGYLHLGHFYTMMRVDVFARYKRLKGFNVLFPQGWHCTGSPIEAAAKRIRDKEPKQIENMRKMGFSDEDITKFSDPEYWTSFFPKEAKEDYERMGMSVDFRRSFITTSINPHYSAFIEWQFRKLKEGNYITKGEHAVVWDPVLNTPVGDHDRVEGEGVVPQMFLLVKHRLEENTFLVSATLRPDTILGITNLYVNPDTDYLIVKIKVNGKDENWILSEASAERLIQQDWKLKKEGITKGSSLIGRETEEVDGHKVPVLPATFLDPDFGTGLVHSVPSDSADDLIALRDLQKNDKLMERHGLDKEEIKKIKPIPILDTEGFGDVPAEYFLKKRNITNQNQRKQLDEVREELYKLSFYAAKFGKAYKGFFDENIVGVPVNEKKEYVWNKLIEMGWAANYYQLTGKVVSRNLNECIVKIVRDQWFLNYGDEGWKKKARKALSSIVLYPEKARPQFEHVLSWLHHWACAREVGLGTRLPWDKKWVIESLSDSTLYNAYYAFAHLIKDVPAEMIDDSLFDYILLGKGKPPFEKAIKMREEYEYWYPVDFRNSGKDLIQNHLAFYIFNHVALLPEEKWPKGIGVNGWVTVDGQKMSKSLGNMILLREMDKRYSIDPSRLTIMSGGESMDDPNWDSDFARSIKRKLSSFYSFVLDHFDAGSEEKTPMDAWMLSRLHSIIRVAGSLMEKTLFRSASQMIFFEINRAVKWYLKRTKNSPNKHVLNQVIRSQLVMLSPFTPFLCEELWAQTGNEGLIAYSEWPVYDKKKEDPSLEAIERVMERTLSDVQTVLSLANVKKASKITLYVADNWKYDLFNVLAEEMKMTRNPRELIPKIMAKGSLKKHGKDVQHILKKILKSGKIPEKIKDQDTEKTALEKAVLFLESEFDCKIAIKRPSGKGEGKENSALPGKPAILVE